MLAGFFFFLYRQTDSNIFMENQRILNAQQAWKKLEVLPPDFNTCSKATEQDSGGCYKATE